MQHRRLCEDLTVHGHKAGRGESPPALAHLRVGEGEPYLGDLARGKEGVQKLYLSPQEAHIPQPLLVGSLGSRPEAVTLDVHTDEVVIPIGAPQLHGVLASPTAELQYDRVSITEDLIRPVPLVGESHPLPPKCLEGVLKDIGQPVDLGKFL